MRRRASNSRGSPREGWRVAPSSASVTRCRGEGLAQPDPVPGPLRSAGPMCPTLRANPFPEVTDPICRLPLPTLFHRLEAVHLGDLMRIWVRPGTRFNCLHGLFKGRPRRTGHRKSRGALQVLDPYLRSNRFQGSRRLYKEERTLPRASADVVRFVCVTALAPGEGAISVSRFGNINPIPFR